MRHEPLLSRMRRVGHEVLSDRWKALAVSLAVMSLLQFGAMASILPLTRRNVIRAGTPAVARGPGGGDEKRHGKNPEPATGLTAFAFPADSASSPPSVQPARPLSGNSLLPTPGAPDSTILSPMPPPDLRLAGLNPVAGAGSGSRSQPPLPRLLGTIETSSSAAALMEDGNAVEVFAVGSKTSEGWLVERVENGIAYLSRGAGKSRVAARVSIPAYVPQEARR
jgi:hypothetical protein